MVEYISFEDRDFGMITVVIQKVNSDYLEENFDILLEKLPVTRREYVLAFKQRYSAIVELATSLLLDDIVNQQTKAINPFYDVKKDALGKPYIPQLPDLYFNISHSGDYIAIAYGNENVGVDLQQIVVYRPKVAEKCCTFDELKWMQQEDVDYRFTFLWTIKESYAKYTGKGLAEDFKEIRIDFDDCCIKDTEVKYVSERLNDYIITVCAENLNNPQIIY